MCVWGGGGRGRVGIDKIIFCQSKHHGVSKFKKSVGG